MKLKHSPVNPDFSSELIDELKTDRIRTDYKYGFNINIDKFIESETLKRYRCLETNLEFYRGIKPGDGGFYAELMKNDWYYDPWKWEHEIVKNILNLKDSLIEIGSGSGGFLKRLKENGIKATGIEINKDAVATAKSSGLNVTEENLEKFARDNENRFDWSVSFQVLEHIEDVAGFLKNSVKLLKRGGKLVISVPNNDSFIGKMYNPLNLPPHHMNRWNRDSLEKIAPIFGLKVEKFELEPLQKYHYKWYVNSVMEQAKDIYENKPPIIRGAIYRSSKRMIEQWVHYDSENIIGHSIIAIYTKM